LQFYWLNIIYRTVRYIYIANSLYTELNLLERRVRYIQWRLYIRFLAFSLVPKENQELEAALAQKPPAKRRGRKRKVPVVEDDEATNDNDQQIEAPALKTTAKRKTVATKRKTVATKRKTVATAPKTTAKRQRKESVSDDDNIQENESLDEDNDIHQESTAAATTKPAFVINKLLELSDNEDNLSEGNFSYF